MRISDWSSDVCSSDLFISNLIAHANDERLQPVYGITTTAPIDETIVDSLAGYRGPGPVRRGNQAFEQIQKDVYGAVVLSLSQLFFDRRLDHRGSTSLLDEPESLGDRQSPRLNSSHKCAPRIPSST